MSTQAYKITFFSFHVPFCKPMQRTDIFSEISEIVWAFSFSRALIREGSLLKKDETTAQDISKNLSVFHLFSFLFVFTSFTELVAYLAHGDIFYELMQLSDLLYLKKVNCSAVQMYFTLDLLLSFNMSDLVYVGYGKRVKDRAHSSTYYAQHGCLNAGRRISRLEFFIVTGSATDQLRHLQEVLSPDFFLFPLL